MSRYPTTGEMVIVTLCAIGFVTVLAFAAGAIMTVVSILVSESAINSVVSGAPYWFGGLLLGLIIGLHYGERGEYDE